MEKSGFHQQRIEFINDVSSVSEQNKVSCWIFQWIYWWGCTSRNRIVEPRSNINYFHNEFVWGISPTKNAEVRKHLDAWKFSDQKCRQERTAYVCMIDCRCVMQQTMFLQQGFDQTKNRFKSANIKLFMNFMSRNCSCVCFFFLTPQT